MSPSLDQVTPTKSSEFLIGSYNILNPFHAVKWVTEEGLDEGKDNWDTWRREAIIKNIEEAQLDICALQELSDQTIKELNINCSQGIFMQSSSLWKHFTDEEEGAHGVAVFYNPHRFSLVAEQGLKSSDKKYRFAACVDLKDLFSGFTYRVISVHLKGYDPYETDLNAKAESQEKGDQELIEYLAECTQNTNGIDGIFILGDFNEDAQEMDRRGLKSRQGMLINKQFTWTGVARPTETRSSRQIDWIFYRDFHDGMHKIKDIEMSQDLNASDHALTVVKHQLSLNPLTLLMV